MAPSANPLPVYCNRNSYCPHYMGGLNYACDKLPFWAFGECEHRQSSEEISLEFIKFQMGADNQHKQNNSDLIDPGQVDLEFTEYQMDNNHREQHKLNWLCSEEVASEYIDYQMGNNNHQDQHILDWPDMEFPFWF